MRRFKEKILKHHRSGKKFLYGAHLGREYGLLRRNLAHIRSLDDEFRSWIEDGSVTPESGRKWLALLGGTNHDLAEEVLVAYVDDPHMPEVLREAALVNLITPRKRMHSTIEKLWQLASYEHVHQDLAHMVCGGLLKRYVPLEGTNGRSLTFDFGLDVGWCFVCRTVLKAFFCGLCPLWAVWYISCGLSDQAPSR